MRRRSKPNRTARLRRRRARLAPVDVRDLPPVETDVDLGHRVSQTVLRVHDRCDRASYLHLKYRGGPASIEMNRGTLFHDFARLATLELVEAQAGELSQADRDRAYELASGPAEAEEWLESQAAGRMPPERAKDLMNELMIARPELVVSAAERDALRMMARNWAEGSQIAASRLICVEQSFELTVGRWTVRVRIDRAEIDELGVCHVIDYKTGWLPPDAKEFVAGDELDDSGGRWSGDFQTQLYALALAFGTFEDTGLRIAEGIERFHLRLEYPRHLRDAGLGGKDAYVSRLQLVDFREDLIVQLRRLEANQRTGKWQPVPSETACKECPAPHECPLPRHLRPHSQLADASIEEIEHLATWLFFTGKDVSQVRKRLKAATAQTELGIAPLVGHREGFAFEGSTVEEIRDRTELRVAVEGAVEYGHPFDMSEHVKTREATNFSRRKLTDKERDALKREET